jgi:flavin reductase (DIM6/NTAB) family NADH-FMN oxidoreductase RutF
VLHTGPGQVELVHRLGFLSGRDQDKLVGLAHRPGAKTGVPVLADCFCWFECEVGNVMDTGSSTFYMGEVVDAGKGPGTEPMEPAWLRDHLTDEMKNTYLAKLTYAQEVARRMSGEMRSSYRTM